MDRITVFEVRIFASGLNANILLPEQSGGQYFGRRVSREGKVFFHLQRHNGLIGFAIQADIRHASYDNSCAFDRGTDFEPTNIVEFS
jgi:hypothetical protein